MGNSMDGGEQIIAELDWTPSIILGLHGVTGVIAQFSAELMEPKNDSGTATHPKRVDTTALLNCNLTLKLAIMDPAQLTEDGEIGVNGANAPSLAEVVKILDIVPVIVLSQNMVVPTVLEMLPKWERVTKILVQLMVVGVSGAPGQIVPLAVVEELTKEELEHATAQLLNLAVMIVLSMAQVLPKHNDVMKTHVQSTEDSVTGTNGLHAPLNVEEEIKQETDDVTTLSQSSVDWNASAIFQNANVVTWIHVHLNAQHNHFKSYNI